VLLSHHSLIINRLFWKNVLQNKIHNHVLQNVPIWIDRKMNSFQASIISISTSTWLFFYNILNFRHIHLYIGCNDLAFQKKFQQLSKQKAVLFWNKTSLSTVTSPRFQDFISTTTSCSSLSFTKLKAKHNLKPTGVIPYIIHIHVCQL
jgi:hypothetical protein